MVGDQTDALAAEELEGVGEENFNAGCHTRRLGTTLLHAARARGYRDETEECKSPMPCCHPERASLSS